MPQVPHRGLSPAGTCSPDKGAGGFPNSVLANGRKSSQELQEGFLGVAVSGRQQMPRHR